ncbi:MAG: glycosyltransferase family 4 protein [Anaerolineales bacterium]|nr:glycosyltransferase family 4 protein [Anaerolineales bacterium]
MPQKKLRVLMLSWEYPPYVVGGLGAHVAALAPALARAGVRVQIVTPRWKGGELREPLLPDAPTPRRRALPPSVFRVDPPVMDLGNFFADAQQTNLNLGEQAQALYDRVGDFDLIHAHDWLVAFAAMSLKRLHKTPLLATIHATERGRGRGFLGGEMAHAINGTEWWLTYEAWRVITCSQFMRDEVRNYFNVPPDKIDIVPNGVDASPFEELDGVDLVEFRARWARPDERIVFNVGRVVQEKGAPVIVEAAPRVLAEMPNVKFIIAGKGGSVDDLKRRVVELGVQDKVNIAGFVSDPDRNRLFKVADAAIFPSLYEPFGIVALEAMAAKCPVIVSAVGGLQEVVRHDVTGVTIFPNNVESLAWGVLSTLRDRKRARAHAAKAYRVAKKEYHWDRIAAQTIEIYERIARERAKSNW